MALDNEQIICQLLKTEWSLIKKCIESEATFLRKIYNKIKAISKRLINTIIRRIVSAIYELFKMLEDALGLAAISNNMFRDKWCQVMYKCKPMIRKLSKLIGEDFFTWLYGPDKITTFDFSYYGLPKQHFTSKYDAYEYYACRLSLRGLLSNVAKDTVEWTKKALEKTLKYMDVEYWLNRTGYGKKILYYISWYESVFNRIKPYIEDLDAYMDCTFALCDFGASSKNFIDDFCNRYAIGYEKIDVSGTLKTKYFVLPQDLYKEIETHLKETSDIMKPMEANGKALGENTDKLFGMGKPVENNTTETNGETSNEREAMVYDRTQRTNSYTPTLFPNFNSNIRRMTTTLSSPSSDVNV